MSNEKEDFASLVHKMPWILLEFMMTTLVAFGLLSYNDLAAAGQLMIRAAFVMTMLLYCIAAFHMLAVVRNDYKHLPWYWAYGFLALRVVVVLGFICWLNQHGVFLGIGCK